MEEDSRYIEQSEALGPRIRELRQQRGLTLRQLAGKAELSASLLSDIERGNVNPSVASFFSLAAALGVTPHSLIPDESPSAASTPPADSDASACIVRAGQHTTIPLVGGIIWQRLTPRPEGAVEFIQMCYEPGATSGNAMHHHPGREFGLVLDGELTLDLGFERYTLNPGDSVAFDSTTPHRLSNLGDTRLRVAWVNLNTPPAAT